MAQEKRVGAYFDRASITFDTFYDGKRNRAMQWIDQTFRSDMFGRFYRTFETLTPMAGKTVLDVGCGSGPYAAEAAVLGARRVLGIDLAGEMLSLAEARTRDKGVRDRCDFVRGTFPQDAPRETFDYAMVMGVMDYVDTPVAFLQGLHGCIRSKAVLSFPSRHWFRTPLRQVRYRLKKCPVYFYDENEIRGHAAAAGFTRVSVEKLPGAGMDYFVTLSLE